MSAYLALLICAGFVLGMLHLERRATPSVSMALWIPTIWMLQISSKPLGVWFGQVDTGEVDTGSALDRNALTVILLLIVLVAAFNIVSTLIMVVTDKTREIGILRAMGMPARSIRRVFFMQGLVIGIVGTGFGLALGLAAAVLIGQKRLIPLDPVVYFIDHLPVAVQPLDVTLIVVASLAVAAVATIYPAVQAARLYPVEAIRHE